MLRMVFFTWPKGSKKVEEFVYEQGEPRFNQLNWNLPVNARTAFGTLDGERFMVVVDYESVIHSEHKTKAMGKALKRYGVNQEELI